MAENPPKEDQTIDDILLNFSQSTTIHSVSKQTSTVSNRRRVIWGVLFFWSLIYVIYQCSGSIDFYLTSPVNVNNTWRVYNRLDFPAITFCNLNALRMSQVNSTPFFQNISQEYNEKLRSSADRDGIEEQMSKKLQSFTTGLDDSTLKAFGHQRDDFVLKCSWREKSCKDSLSQFYSPMLGNCFTFDSKQENSSLQYATKVGTSQALTLTLNVQSQEYIGPLSSDVGVVVQVHDRNTIAIPAEEGRTIPPGFSTNIAVTKQITKRLEEVYGKEGCRRPDSLTKFFKSLFSVNNKFYSVKPCLKVCYASLSFKHCNCYPPEFQNKESCDVMNRTQSKCLDEVNDYMDRNLARCNCTPPCEENVFFLSSSSAVWPSDANWKYLKYSIENTSAAAYSSNIVLARENLVRINIFYSSFRVMTEREIRAYEFGSLIGDIGGQLGLFVGMSVLSLFEVFELLFDLCMKLYKRVKNRSMVQSPSDDNHS